jgi:hypothetical protein
MRVRLIKKLAEKIDGVDLTGRSVGDLLNLQPREARLLIAEQWAIPGSDSASQLSGRDVPDSGQPSPQISDATDPQRCR